MSKQGIFGSEQKVERFRESPADCSIPKSQDPLFLRQNDYWAIRYHGRTALLKSTRGLHCLAVLLSHPGREFHVRELLFVRSMGTSNPATPGDVPMGVAGGLHAGIPVLDVQAKVECKRRLNELRQDLNEAQRFNDPQRRTDAQNEVRTIVDYLASAIGLGGRDRKTSSDAERARSAVTKCIRKAIQKIGDAIPSLGYHLAARIKTGYFCSYNPHPERPVNWQF
jgi:hypothetical protein